MKATLNDGFEVQINDNCLNDWKFFTTLRKIDKGETVLIVDAAEQLLGGEEEVNRLAEHLQVDGITPADAMISTIAELIANIKELKNS